MVNQRHEFAHSPHRRVQGNLVEVLDDDVVIVRRELGRVVSVCKERVCLTSPDSVNVDAIELDALGRVSPRAVKQIHAMSTRDDAAEDFLEVELGAACLWILVILPVQYEYAH